MKQRVGWPPGPRWSLLARSSKPSKPTGASAADPGVRPTLGEDHSLTVVAPIDAGLERPL